MKHRTMKKAWILLLALLLLSTLPACGAPADEGADSARPENEPARQEDACTAYSTQGVTSRSRRTGRRRRERTSFTPPAAGRPAASTARPPWDPTRPRSSTRR